MVGGGSLTPGSGPGSGADVAPRAPLGHLSRLGFALRSAPDVDSITRAVVGDLGALPGVRRVGLALTEGGGRRLRFASGDPLETDPDAPLAWCHIDAYDDVPLTAVVRTGEPLLGPLEDFERDFPGVVAKQRDNGIVALVAWPLPGTGSPIGGLMISYDEPQAFDEAQRGLLEAAARRTAEAVRRVRIATGRGPGDAAPDDPALLGEGERYSILLESDPRAPGAARRFLRDRAAAWRLPEELVDSAQLCLSELVTNVVMHARTTSELTLHLEHGVLTVVVRDLGGSSRAGDPGIIAAADEAEDPLRVFGRGLMLVDALASRWGQEVDASGTTAWFILELDGDHASPTSKTG